MATVTVSTSIPNLEPGVRLLTAADIAAMPEHLPSGPVSFELHHGRLVAMSPPGARHGNLQARFAGELIYQGEAKGHGKAYTEVGIVLGRNPDHVFGADVAFVARQSLPAKISSEGFLETMPELVVEVRSKNDTTTEINEKVADYLKSGVKLVWIAEPANETVVEHRSGQPPKTLGKDDTLPCEDVIPGFRLSLADLFRQ
ncbi:MAG: Uma2 family endonuclease [Pirellulales bacterium]